MRTRVKICGITRPADAGQAAALGADAIGLVFYPRSPRAVTPSQARDIISALPPFVSVVGLFVDAAPGEVVSVLQRVAVDILQFHGNESPSYCEGFGRPYLKAVAMKGGVEPADYAARFRSAAGLLLDGYREGVAGGTGTRFDWSRVPGRLAKPVILAGGLSPDNVAAAIRQVRPYAVDVSSGVESMKGVKDPGKMRRFIEQVATASRQAAQED